MTIRRCTYWTFLLLLAFLLFPRCAGTIVTTNHRELVRGDSLMVTGDYLHAKMAFVKLLQSEPSPEVAEEAQYRIAYISIFYGNPFADWEAALSEFTTYKQKYPTGKYIDEVNTWLSVLHALQSYNAGYHSQADQTEELISQHSTEQRRILGLADSLFHCKTERDSLIRELQAFQERLREYEELILRLQ